MDKQCFIILETSALLWDNNDSKESFQNKSRPIFFWNYQSKPVSSSYYIIDEFSSALNSLLKNLFSFLQTMLSGINKKPWNLKGILSVANTKFSIIALTSDDRTGENYAWQISNYTLIHEIRQTRQKEMGMLSLCSVTLILRYWERKYMQWWNHTPDGRNCNQSG